MNQALKWIHRVTLVALAAGVACTAVMAQDDDSANPPAESATLAKLSDQISIMRVLVTKAINEGPFAERYAEAAKRAREKAHAELAEAVEEPAPEHADMTPQVLSEFYTRFTYSTPDTFTSHTRGFYASGLGVMFSTEVRTPVRQVEVEAEAEATETPREADEWAAAMEEARSGSSVSQKRLLEADLARAAGHKTPTVRWELDSAYIQDAIDAMTQKIAEYGMRVTELPDDESFVIAMRFEPDFSSSSWMNPIRSTGVRGSSVYTLSYSGGRSAAAQHVVVQIPRALVRQHDEGSLSLEQLRRRVAVTTIASGSSSGGVGSTVWTIPQPPTAPRAPSGIGIGGR